MSSKVVSGDPLCIQVVSLPPASAVKIIKTEPSVCVCVCQFVNTFMATCKMSCPYVKRFGLESTDTLTHRHTHRPFRFYDLDRSRGR